jgi:predicted MFS family arabinose efflux permease
VTDRRLLAPLFFATFAVIYSGTVIGALVTPIATEFGVSAGSVGLAAAAYATPGILIGLVAGPLSDRFGRGWFLAGGTLVLGSLTIVSATSPTFEWLAITRALAGLGAAVILPNMMATVADRFPYRERARIVGFVFTSNTIGGIAGLTLAGIVAERYGWRVSLASAGVAALIAFTLLVVLHGRAHTATRAVSMRSLYTSVLTDRSALCLLGSNLLGVVALTSWALYIVPFFQQTYGLAQGLASTYALVQAGGLLVGSQIGGRLGDVGQKQLLCAALAVYGVILFTVLFSAPALPFALIGLLAAATCYGLRATANAALMSEQAVSARTTVFAFSAATVSAGTVVAGAAGGRALDVGGFGALGLFCLVSAVLSALIVAAFVRERATDEPVAPAAG